MVVRFFYISFLIVSKLSLILGLSVTADGCPFSYDFGKFDFKYKRVQICDSLLPDKIVGLKSAAFSTRPFTFTMDPVPDSGSDYYDLVINVMDDFVDTTVIAGAAIRIQKIDSNGEPGSPVGHFDTTPDSGYSNWKPYCCGTSKFHNLVYTFIADASKRLYQLIIRWYPLNFKEGFIVFHASVFSNESTYWKLKTPNYKIPMLVAQSTERVPVEEPVPIQAPAPLPIPAITQAPLSITVPAPTQAPVRLPPTTQAAPLRLPPTTQAPLRLPPTTQAPLLLPPTTQAPVLLQPREHKYQLSQIKHETVTRTAIPQFVMNEVSTTAS